MNGKEELTQICQNCGQANKMGAESCVNCGEQLLKDGTRVSSEDSHVHWILGEEDQYKKTQLSAHEVKWVLPQKRSKFKRHRKVLYVAALVLCVVFVNKHVVIGDETFFERGKHVFRTITKYSTQRFNQIYKSFFLVERSIYVSADPEADVFLDGELLGATPLTIEDLEAGTHILKMKNPNYSDSSLTQFIWNKVRRDSIFYAFQNLRMSSLAITSEPNTKVYIDSQYYGKVSSTLSLVVEDLIPGQHQVQLSNSGLYAWWTGEIELQPGEQGKISRRWGIGSLMVNAIPWGTVFIDGVKVDETPLTVDRIAAGRHKLKVERSGQPSSIKNITIWAGKTTKISFRD